MKVLPKGPGMKAKTSSHGVSPHRCGPGDAPTGGFLLGLCPTRPSAFDLPFRAAPKRRTLRLPGSVRRHHENRTTVPELELKNGQKRGVSVFQCPLSFWRKKPVLKPWTLALPTGWTK